MPTSETSPLGVLLFLKFGTSLDLGKQGFNKLDHVIGSAVKVEFNELPE